MTGIAPSVPILSRPITLVPLHTMETLSILMYNHTQDLYFSTSLATCATSGQTKCSFLLFKGVVLGNSSEFQFCLSAFDEIYNIIFHSQLFSRSIQRMYIILDCFLL